MSVGLLVMAFVIIMILGNVMAAKPKHHEVRLGEFRLLARKKGLNPKLVATPEWIKTHQKFTQNSLPSLIAQYTLINDDWRNPLMQYIFDQTWQSLDKKPIQSIKAPAHLSPYFIGLTIKSNSISLYWHDELYLKRFSIRDDISQTIENDLNILSDYLASFSSSK